MQKFQDCGERELRWPFLMYDIPTTVVVGDTEESVSREITKTNLRLSKMIFSRLLPWSPLSKMFTVNRQHQSYWYLRDCVEMESTPNPPGEELRRRGSSSASE